MIILIGESGSGKTTVAKILQEKYGMKMITTYTTRPMRDGEVNGVDYHFISVDEFCALRERGFFAETAEYRGWFYGSAKDDYKYKDSVAILTPHGMRQVKKFFEEDPFEDDPEAYFNVFYINIPRRDRLVKLLQRGDNIEEAYRRSLSDVGQFDGIEDEVDFVIYNDGYRFDPDHIASTINGLYLS